MKKFAIIALALIMAFSLVACGGNDEPAEPVAPSGETAPVETPAPGGELVTDGVSFTIPEEFAESALEGTDLCYKAPDNSMITVTTAPSDSDFEFVSKEALEQALANGLNSASDSESEITTNDFNFTEIDGAPAYFWDATIVFNGMQMRQLLIGINADYAYAVTYTDASADEAHMDDFYTSFGTITLNKVAA